MLSLRVSGSLTQINTLIINIFRRPRHLTNWVIFFLFVVFSYIYWICSKKPVWTFSFLPYVWFEETTQVKEVRSFHGVRYSCNGESLNMQRHWMAQASQMWGFTVSPQSRKLNVFVFWSSVRVEKKLLKMLQWPPELFIHNQLTFYIANELSVKKVY